MILILLLLSCFDANFNLKEKGRNRGYGRSKLDRALESAFNKEDREQIKSLIESEERIKKWDAVRSLQILGSFDLELCSMFINRLDKKLPRKARLEILEISSKNPDYSVCSIALDKYFCSLDNNDKKSLLSKGAQEGNTSILRWFIEHRPLPELFFADRYSCYYDGKDNHVLNFLFTRDDNTLARLILDRVKSEYKGKKLVEELLDICLCCTNNLAEQFLIDNIEWGICSFSKDVEDALVRESNIGKSLISSEGGFRKFLSKIKEDEKNLNEATARIFMNKIVNLSNNRGGYSIVKEVYESEQNLLMGILELCDELGLKISIKKELFVLGLEKYDTEIMGYCEALNWPARYYSWGGELDELRIISHVLEVESYSDEMMGCVLCSLFPAYSRHDSLNSDRSKKIIREFILNNRKDLLGAIARSSFRGYFEDLLNQNLEKTNRYGYFGRELILTFEQVVDSATLIPGFRPQLLIEKSMEGDIEIFKKLIDAGNLSLSLDLFKLAVKKESIQILNYFVENSFNFEEDILKLMLIEKQNINLAVWAVQNGFTVKDKDHDYFAEFCRQNCFKGVIDKAKIEILLNSGIIKGNSNYFMDFCGICFDDGAKVSYQALDYLESLSCGVVFEKKAELNEESVFLSGKLDNFFDEVDASENEAKYLKFIEGCLDKFFINTSHCDAKKFGYNLINSYFFRDMKEDLSTKIRLIALISDKFDLPLPEICFNKHLIELLLMDGEHVDLLGVLIDKGCFINVKRDLPFMSSNEGYSAYSLSLRRENHDFLVERGASLLMGKLPSKEGMKILLDCIKEPESSIKYKVFSEPFNIISLLDQKIKVCLRSSLFVISLKDFDFLNPSSIPYTYTCSFAHNNEDKFNPESIYSDLVKFARSFVSSELGKRMILEN
ncbi:MAG TPA: hypothetical protein DEP20_02220 [Fusobacteria bacterium]|nr:hypothetical protein [Fusobacteriota bacterium]|tara:strand:- start:892 stop:3579 length:2688 start_codon:yes stop_codon:yes gene_type:complete